MATAHSQPMPADKMTYEEFLEWADEDTLAEWVDGQVVMASPAGLEHQLLAGFLYKVLSAYVDFKQLGVALPPPFQMKLPRSSGREPDVIFLANEHRDQLRETYLDGPADLVVEVISPDSVKRDRDDKFREYRQGGIPEYWLLDPGERQAEFYRLDARGAYRRVAPDAQGIYHSRTVPGFWLDVAWLWQDPLPAVERVVAAVAGEPYVRYWQEQWRQQGLS